jgi:hypothetical protein
MGVNKSRIYAAFISEEISEKVLWKKVRPKKLFSLALGFCRKKLDFPDFIAFSELFS